MVELTSVLLQESQYLDMFGSESDHSDDLSDEDSGCSLQAAYMFEFFLFNCGLKLTHGEWLDPSDGVLISST